MWLLPQKRVLAPKIVFFRWKKFISLHVMMKKVTDRGFLAFWTFENERKFRRKLKNGPKNLKFRKKWVLLFQTPSDVRIYHHHTSYYTDHQFPTITTNRLVIHREFYLFLNQTVLFICSMNNLSPMRKLSLFQKTTKLQLYCEYNCEHETAPCLRIIIITL